MPRPDGRIEPGQPLKGAISARAWNRAQDAADLVLGEHGGFSAGDSNPVLKPYTWAYCKPSTTVARWGVLEITGMAITPTSSDSDDATKSFQDSPVLTGGTPSDTTTSWCVAVEPIEAGKVGRVAVGGVVQCKVEVSKAGDKFVACNGSGLTTGVRGEGLILWKQGGTGAGKWALVRLGATATIEQQVITGVSLTSDGLVFTRETVYVIGKKTPSPADVTINVTACT